MKLLPALLALPFLLPLPASAGQAAAKGENVLVIRVSDLRLPAQARGDCVVAGVVDEILAGKAFRAGQDITVKVPCGKASVRRRPPQADASTVMVDPAVLSRSRLGAVRLDDAGQVIWKPTSSQFFPRRRESYGADGTIWGYRVLDGVILPLQV